jgi:hypothetical protein
MQRLCGLQRLQIEAEAGEMAGWSAGIAVIPTGVPPGQGRRGAGDPLPYAGAVHGVGVSDT